jgi:hypothetical protein
MRLNDEGCWRAIGSLTWGSSETPQLGDESGRNRLKLYMTIMRPDARFSITKAYMQTRTQIKEKSHMGEK